MKTVSNPCEWNDGTGSFLSEKALGQIRATRGELVKDEGMAPLR